MSGKSKSGQNCAFVEYEKPDQAGSGTPERWKWTPGPIQAMGVGSKIGQEGDSPKWMDCCNGRLSEAIGSLVQKLNGKYPLEN